MCPGSDQHSPHASALGAWQWKAGGGCFQFGEKWSKWNESGVKKLTGMFACGPCSAELIQLRWTWTEDRQKSNASILTSLLEEADGHLKSPAERQTWDSLFSVHLPVMHWTKAHTKTHIWSILLLQIWKPTLLSMQEFTTVPSQVI